MTANRIHFSLLIVAMVGALAGCYKAPEFINPVYSCECGSVTFGDSLYNLKMAEAVVPDSLEPLSEATTSWPISALRRRWMRTCRLMI